MPSGGDVSPDRGLVRFPTFRDEAGMHIGLDDLALLRHLADSTVSTVNRAVAASATVSTQCWSEQRGRESPRGGRTARQYQVAGAVGALDHRSPSSPRVRPVPARRCESRSGRPGSPHCRSPVWRARRAPWSDEQPSGDSVKPAVAVIAADGRSCHIRGARSCGGNSTGRFWPVSGEP